MLQRWWAWLASCWGQQKGWLLSNCYSCSGLLSLESSRWHPPFSRQVVVSLPILLQRVAEEFVLKTLALPWTVLRTGFPCFWGIWWLPWFRFPFFSDSAMLISRSVSGSCTSASIVGAGLFSTSLKWSAQLASSPPCLINRRVRGPVVLSLMALIILVFSVGGLFCLTCQVFHVGPLVCPCHPLYCEPVCFSLVLLVSLFQPLWSCVHDFLLLDFSAFDGLSGNYCDPLLPLHLPASQAGVADLCIGYSIRTVWHEINKDSRL